MKNRSCASRRFQPDVKTATTLRRVLLAALAAAVLLLTFVAYLQPSFVLDLANRFILC